MEYVEDGRSARRERNRDAVIDALVELTTEGNDEPSIEEIAERAGVSYRSVYRYFGDRTAMMDAATDRAMAWLQPKLINAAGPVMIGEPLGARLDSIITSRLDMYEQVADMVRATTVRAFSNRRIDNVFINARSVTRSQIGQRFSTELDEYDEAERQVRISAMDHAMTFQAIDYFRHEREHSREQVAGHLDRTLRSALASGEVGA